MAADFPDNPNVNDTFTVGDRSWIWNGTTWDAAVEEVLSADAPITFNSSTRTVGLDQTGVQDGRNYIINGAFDIWQRGTSFNPPINSETYLADRYFTNRNGSGATVTISQESFSPADIEALGFGDAKYFYRYDQSVAGSGATYTIYADNSIEDVRTLAGQTVTFSFWAKSDASRDVRLLLGQIFGSGGSSNSFQELTETIGTSWTRYSKTFNVNSVAGKTIGDGSHLAVRFQAASASLNTVHQVDIWGVQLEAGSVATPFKRNANSIAGELDACKRYYQVIADGANVAIATVTYYRSDWAFGSYRFEKEMRVSPTLEVATGTDYYRIFSNNSSDLLTLVGQVIINKQGFRIDTGNGNASGVQGNAGFLQSLDSNAYIAVSAEL